MRFRKREARDRRYNLQYEKVDYEQIKKYPKDKIGQALNKLEGIVGHAFCWPLLIAAMPFALMYDALVGENYIVIKSNF